MYVLLNVNTSDNNHTTVALLNMGRSLISNTSDVVHMDKSINYRFGNNGTTNASIIINTKDDKEKDHAKAAKEARHKSVLVKFFLLFFNFVFLGFFVLNYNTDCSM